MSHLFLLTALFVALLIATPVGFFVLASFDYLRSGGAAATTTGSNDDLQQT